MSVSSSWLNRKEVLVPPTRSTPASFTAVAHSLAAMSASSATIPSASSASNASLSISAATGSSAAAASSVVSSAAASVSCVVSAAGASSALLPHAARLPASAMVSSNAVDFFSHFKFLIIILLFYCSRRFDVAIIRPLTYFVNRLYMIFLFFTKKAVAQEIFLLCIDLIVRMNNSRYRKKYARQLQVRLRTDNWHKSGKRSGYPRWTRPR